MRGLAASFACRANISASTLWVKHTLAASSPSGFSTAAWTKSNTTTSKRSLARVSARHRWAAGLLSATTFTGSAPRRSIARRQRGRGKSGAQPTKRSATPDKASDQASRWTALAGLIRVMSKAPPFIPRRMLVVRMRPPVSFGKRKTGETNARRGRGWITSKCPRIQPRARCGYRRNRTGPRSAALTRPLRCIGGHKHRRGQSR
jgi:hypothetical protein